MDYKAREDSSHSGFICIMKNENKNIRVKLIGINQFKIMPNIETFVKQQFGFSLTQEQSRQALGMYFRQYGEGYKYKNLKKGGNYV